MFSKDMTIASYDPELASAISAEIQRQEDHIELIASENYTSPRVMEAQGSVLTINTLKVIQESVITVVVRM